GHWDEGQSVQENLQRFRRENLFGKASRSRVEDILAIFRQRFCEDETLASPLRKLAHAPTPSVVLDRVLYFHAPRSDRLLYDFAGGFLFEKALAGEREILPGEAQQFITGVLRQHGLSWSADTLRRVTQGLLATLRDFGILEGTVRKRIAPTYLPVEAFAYL